MTGDDLLKAVNERMAQLRLRQEDVAAACGCTQGHLSKVLKHKVKLARKTEVALRGWLGSADGGDGTDDAREVRELVDRLVQGPAERRIRIMQLLRIIDGMAR
ncbi:transcriptional regulator with XRE-family HTH domain [Azospirillum agricola]|uniref:hypothetical protein n=1 Tax=Azospirillum agricola TaxID=1720247 RepID=UPI001AE89D0A|nr:hypothetical protein [Azospirillum agricola]MBP2229682.1 transcriptional regulator with XRE-family HTH domain [Azospirillum agricola]